MEKNGVKFVKHIGDTILMDGALVNTLPLTKKKIFALREDHERPLCVEGVRRNGNC
jgi:hypothetical protein